MPIPVEQAFATAPGQPPAKAKTGGLSVDDVYAQPAPAPEQSSGVGSAVGDAVKGQSKWWTDYKQLANDYLQSLKEDFQASPQTPAASLLQSGKTALDALNLLLSPATSAVKTGIIDPAKALISKMGGLVEDHVAADEEWTPQERRDAYLAGKTLGQKYPKGIDWKIHKENVQRTVEGLNEMVEPLVYALPLPGTASAITKATKLSSRELEALRLEKEAAAQTKEVSVIAPIEKPRIQVTGKDAATGKPRVRVLTPEQASAGVSAATRDVHMEVTPMISAAPNSTQAVKDFARDWNELHATMTPRYVAAMESGRPVGAHTVLDTMLANTKGEYQKQLISKLRQYVDDVPVNFVREVQPTSAETKLPEKGKVYGLYSPSDHSIQVRTDPTSAHTTHTTLHEITHAATLNWMRANPNHELVNEMEELLSVAKKNLVGTHYGLMNSEEFVAEAFTSATFQKALSGIKSGSLTSNLFSRLADVVRRVFGLPPGQGAFLHRIMKTSESIMAEQAAAGRVGGSGAAAAMKVPKVAEGTVERLKGYVDEMIRAVNPEALGEKAKAAAAVIASKVAENIHRQAMWRTGSLERERFWQSHASLTDDFIRRYEKGIRQPTSELQSIESHYRLWAREIAIQDNLITGLSYQPQDNYLFHAFEDSQGVADFFQAKYGKKWGDPGFIKDREFELYSQAKAAGFTPKFKNPEEIMLARQYASDIAEMREGILKDLERYGIATAKVKGQKPPANTTPRRAPSGQWYNVDNQAQAVLHNAFDTLSLWNVQGAVGDLFRAGMVMKNTIVPLRLAVSGFHALHVLHIDNADATALAWKEMLAGKRSAASALAAAGKSLLLYRSLYENPKMGGRLLKVWRGQIRGAELTASDRQALQYMVEGGFTPEMSSVYRTNAIESFQRALREHSVTAIFKAPFALVNLLQKPLMEIWIPNLKASAYTRQVRSAVALDQTLINNPLKRQLAFRRIAKSIDNRFGEMSYNTLFWKRWIKDLGVLNTLSLGWNLGFIREYGGGAMDLGQFVKGSDKAQKIKEGLLDRPLFLLAYNSTALGYGGLMTWAMTGQFPETLTDYVFPQTGETDADGKPQRVNTMFYTREFASIYKHMQDQGVVSGLGQLASSKASGVIGLAGEWYTGLDAFGKEYRDPDAPIYKKLEQTLAYTLTGLQPISVRSAREQISEQPVKSTALSVAGFSPVAKYLSESKTEAGIKQAYGKYVAPQQTPYDRAQYSDDSRRLRTLLKKDDPKADDLLEQMTEKYQLSRGDVHRLRKTLTKGPPPSIRMFSRLPWTEQKKLLDSMSEEEREIYLPHSNREHLRRRYEAPE